MTLEVPGRVVVLNGAPRSGKSSIVAALQDRSDATWLNLGVDVFSPHVTPPRLRPGMGLRPGGGERPDIEAVLPSLFGAFYDSVAAHSRHGFDVVVDVGHHDAYASPLGLLADAARRLEGLPAWLVGVYCPVEVIVERRERSTPGDHDTARDARGQVAAPVLRWQEEVHRPGIYDLTVDTSDDDPRRCADRIVRHLAEGPPPSVLHRLRTGGSAAGDDGTSSPC
jgi:chloramphenicol 3-O phosphotransferase